METSDAAKTVRAKWGGSFAPEEPGPSNAGEPTPASVEALFEDKEVIEAQDNAHHSQPAYMTKVLEIMTRIAVAVERLADKASAATSSVVVPAANVVPPAVGVPVANVSVANDTSVAASIMPAASAAVINSSSFQAGVIEMSDDSDEEIEPGKRCGVCRGPCEVMNALDCGHYPFCGACVDKMVAKTNSVLHKLKCPYCNKLVKDTLELNLY